MTPPPATMFPTMSALHSKWYHYHTAGSSDDQAKLHCHEAVGDGRQKGFILLGEQCVAGSTYCSAHLPVCRLMRLLLVVLSMQGSVPAWLPGCVHPAWSALPGKLDTLAHWP